MTKLLLIVDLQHEFVPLEKASFSKKIFDLIKTWPEQDVFWMRYVNHPDSLFSSELDWFECIESPEAGLITGDKVKPLNVIDHYGYGLPPQQVERLKHYHTVYVCGADTDACVLAACFNLWDAGIRPFVLADYCLSSGEEDFHNMALKIMERQFGPQSIIKGHYSFSSS